MGSGPFGVRVAGLCPLTNAQRRFAGETVPDLGMAVSNARERLTRFKTATSTIVQVRFFNYY